MPRAPKECGRYGCGALVVGTTYCPTHKAEAMRTARPSPSSMQRRPNAVRTQRAAAVQAWVTVNGWVCPGYGRDPHPSHDLTAAHSVAVADGGAGSQLRVLCRSCNSRQGRTPT